MFLKRVTLNMRGLMCALRTDVVKMKAFLSISVSLELSNVVCFDSEHKHILTLWEMHYGQNY